MEPSCWEKKLEFLAGDNNYAVSYPLRVFFFGNFTRDDVQRTAFLFKVG